MWGGEREREKYQGKAPHEKSIYTLKKEEQKGKTGFVWEGSSGEAV
jgi:hypothetical protein